MARLYRREVQDNPYVWFETLNEPTGHPSSDSDTQSVEGWFTLQKELGDVIHEKAPNSVIVFDGTSLGQDKGTWACTHAPSFGNPPDWWQQLSGGLVHGQDLQARYGRDNVVISPHFYGQWAGNKDWGCLGPADDPYQYWREDMQTYLNKLSTAGVPVVVGEWGAPDRLADEDWAMGGSWDAAHIFMEQVAPNQAVKPGSLNWACSAGDAYPLMNPDGYCLHWSGDMSVLTWQGRDLDDYARLVNP